MEKVGELIVKSAIAFAGFTSIDPFTPFYPMRGMKFNEEDITGARTLRKNTTAAGRFM